ncbi:hypothetical protein BHE74_00026910 [Ensete ventricosum]|nr:hypothetical protein BHE74_00026910 [Ensete ventricosum]
MFAAVQWNWQTILIGTAFLAFLLSAKCIVRSQSGEEEEELVLCLKLLMQKTKVCISFAIILHRATSPRIALLGNLPGATLHRNIEQSTTSKHVNYLCNYHESILNKQYPEATMVPGILIVRVDSAIYFSNSNCVRERYILNYEYDQKRIQAEGMLTVWHCIGRILI